MTLIFSRFEGIITLEDEIIKKETRFYIPDLELTYQRINNGAI